MDQIKQDLADNEKVVAGHLAESTETWKNRIDEYCKEEWKKNDARSPDQKLKKEIMMNVYKLLLNKADKTEFEQSREAKCDKIDVESVIDL